MFHNCLKVHNLRMKNRPDIQFGFIFWVKLEMVREASNISYLELPYNMSIVARIGTTYSIKHYYSQELAVGRAE